MEDKEKIEYLQEELLRTQRIVERIGKHCGMMLAHRHQDNTIVTPVRSPEEESYGGYHFRIGDFKKSE